MIAGIAIIVAFLLGWGFGEWRAHRQWSRLCAASEAFAEGWKELFLKVLEKFPAKESRGVK